MFKLSIESYEIPAFLAQSFEEAKDFQALTQLTCFYANVVRDYRGVNVWHPGSAFVTGDS